MRNRPTDLSRLLGTLLCACGLAAIAQAQIAAPQLLCTDNDTLRWMVPNINCGPVLGYQIFAAQAPEGPFGLLASINNPAQDSYYHDTSLSPGTWYYYMNSLANCPAASTLYSDTLDNADPLFPAFNFVSVAGNTVQISWQRGLSPETAAYIIFRENASGFFDPIDTVFGASNTFYTDLTANPEAASANYTIVSADACGNTSIFNTATHATMLLTQNVDDCERRIRLSWNRYQNWADGVAAQEVWASVGGGPEQMVASLPDSADSYAYGPISNGTDYCLRIRSIERNGGNSAYSNRICVQPSVVQPMPYIFLRNVVTQQGGTVRLDWDWPTGTDALSAEVLQAGAPEGPYTNWADLDASLLDQPSPSATLDLLSTTRPIYFRIQTRDLCDSLRQSNYAASMVLRGSPRIDAHNFLSWSGYAVENGEFDAYRLYRIAPIGPPSQLFDSNNPDKYDFKDVVDWYEPEDARICYYVESLGGLPGPDGALRSTYARSNIACVEQDVIVRVPTAFVPDGVNGQFRPALIFPDNIAAYEMTVYDRWGKRLFQSVDAAQGWDGTYGGERQPQGVYTYALWLEQADGTRIEKRGTVMLVR